MPALASSPFGFYTNCMTKHVQILLVAIFILVVVGFVLWREESKAPTQETNNVSVQSSSASTPAQNTTTGAATNQIVLQSGDEASVNTEAPAITLAEPIAEFTSRITKKSFGTYITPQNSPVQPERFSGYHTGVDVEYGDITSDVPVMAIADGKIVYSSIVDGYGGIIILQFRWQDKDYLALYGHLRPSTMPDVGTTFNKNQQLALLGTAYSSETDGERRHLHFAISSGTTIRIRGYVTKQSDLSSWIDPLSLY